MQQFYKDLKQKHIFKIALVGETGSGKTSILNRFIKDEFPKETFPTIGGDYYTKSMSIYNNITIKAQIWDTTGQARYDSISSLHISKCKGIILAYDITNRKSFEMISDWLAKVKKVCEKDCSIILVGNKCDLLEEDGNKREISFEEGKSFAKQHELLFKEVSAKSNKNINSLFEELLNEIYSKFTFIPPSTGRENLSNGSNGSACTIIESKTEKSNYCFCF